MKDKIIQIIDSDGAIYGLSESGKTYEYIGNTYERGEDTGYMTDDKGNRIIETLNHWKLLIDSPETTDKTPVSYKL